MRAAPHGDNWCFIAALCCFPFLAGCPSNADDDASSDGATDTTSDPGETGTNGSGTAMDWPECVSPQDEVPEMAWYFLESTWLYPELKDESRQQARCNVTGSRLDDDRIIFDMSCTDADGMQHDLPLSFPSGVELAERLEILSGQTGLQLDFEVLSMFLDNPYDNLTIRDEEGTLLVAATTIDSGDDSGDYEAVQVGAPYGWEDPATWYAPFDGFVLRDGLCPQQNCRVGCSATVNGWERRLAIEAMVGNDVYRAFDHGEYLGIEVGDTHNGSFAKAAAIPAR